MEGAEKEGSKSACTESIVDDSQCLSMEKYKVFKYKKFICSLRIDKVSISFAVRLFL